MYVDAGNMQVVIVAHSYGTTSMSYWLPKMDQEWKDIYIKAYVAIAGFNFILFCIFNGLRAFYRSSSCADGCCIGQQLWVCKQNKKND